jgi:hypothetical protein
VLPILLNIPKTYKENAIILPFFRQGSKPQRRYDFTRSHILIMDSTQISLRPPVCSVVATQEGAQKCEGGDKQSAE